MKVEPYLFFGGRCEEALAFYQEALGAERLELMRYAESPEPTAMSIPPDWQHKVMHSLVRIGESMVMASDGLPGHPATFQGFSLSLQAPDEATAQRWFAALSEGGQVEMPLGPTFYSPSFGMLSDRFGLGWMVIVLSPQS